jgi:endogenous inhibitor of DNA gyrase (YacG/DUF329 family)
MTRVWACPICKKVAIKDGNKVFPFCSERCQMVDLGKWLDEEYRVPEKQNEGNDRSDPAKPE